MDSSIFTYLDYRLYLKQRIRQLPHHGRGEMGKIARALNLSSTTVSQVFSGEKNLSLEQAQELTIYLGLPKLESDYLLILVQQERAGTQKLKKYFREKRDSLRLQASQVEKRISSHRSLTEEQKAQFYSSPLYSMVHLFTSLDGGKTATEIGDAFHLPPLRLHEILNFLLESGLIRFLEDRYQMSEASTHVGKNSPHLYRHHTNWRIAALQKAGQLTDEELMFTANISLGQADFPRVREKLMQCIQEIVELVKESPSEKLANLNIDLFWMK